MWLKENDRTNLDQIILNIEIYFAEFVLISWL